MLLSDVCLSRTLGVTREQRPRKTKIGTEVAHVTRDSDTIFRIKRSTVKVTRPLWFVLAGQHGHTVMVAYPYTYMMYIVSPLGGLSGSGNISWRLPAYSLLHLALCFMVTYFACFYFSTHCIGGVCVCVLCV